MPKEQPSFNLSNAMGQPKINQGQSVEFMQEYSLISADSQETCMMANGNDVTLESFSAVGTPVQVSKKMPEDFRASLLDTEKLMKESPKRMQEEREERRVYNNSSGMEIEKM